MSCSVPGSNSGQHIAFSHHVSVFSCLTVFHSLYFMSLTLLRTSGQIFYRMSPNVGLSDVFLYLDWGCGFLWIISQRHGVLIIIPGIYDVIGDVNPHRLVKMVPARFLHNASICPFPYLILWKWITNFSLHSREAYSPPTEEESV